MNSAAAAAVCGLWRSGAIQVLYADMPVAIRRWAVPNISRRRTFWAAEQPQDEERKQRLYAFCFHVTR